MEQREQRRAAVSVQQRPVDPADLGLRLEAGQRVAAQRHQQLGVDDRELALEPRPEVRDLVGPRVAVARRTRLDDVGDEHLLAGQPGLLEQPVEQASGVAHERAAAAILAGPGRLADEDDRRLHAALPRHLVRAGQTGLELAAVGADLLGDPVQLGGRRGGGDGAHVTAQVTAGTNRSRGVRLLARKPNFEERLRQRIEASGRDRHYRVRRLFADLGFDAITPETRTSLESRLSAVGLAVVPSLAEAGPTDPVMVVLGAPGESPAPAPRESDEESHEPTPAAPAATNGHASSETDDTNPEEAVLADQQNGHAPSQIIDIDPEDAVVVAQTTPDADVVVASDSGAGRHAQEAHRALAEMQSERERQREQQSILEERIQALVQSEHEVRERHAADVQRWTAELAAVQRQVAEAEEAVTASRLETVAERGQRSAVEERVRSLTLVEHNLRQAIEEQRGEYAAVQGELERTRGDVVEMQRRLDEARDGLESELRSRVESEQALARAQAEIEQRIAELESYRAEHERTVDELRQHGDDQLAQAEAEHRRTVKELEERSEAERAEAAAEHQRAVEFVQQLREAVTRQEQEIADRDAQLAEGERQLAEAQERIEAGDRQAAALQEAIDELEASVQARADETEAVQASLEQAKDLLRQVAQERDEAQAELSRLAPEVARLEDARERAAAAEARVAEFAETRAMAMADRDTAQREHAKMRTALEDSLGRIESLEAERERLAEQLEERVSSERTLRTELERLETHALRAEADASDSDQRLAVVTTQLEAETKARAVAEEAVRRLEDENEHRLAEMADTDRRLNASFQERFDAILAAERAMEVRRAQAEEEMQQRAAAEQAERATGTAELQELQVRIAEARDALADLRHQHDDERKRGAALEARLDALLGEGLGEAPAKPAKPARARAVEEPPAPRVDQLMADEPAAAPEPEPEPEEPAISAEPEAPPVAAEPPASMPEEPQAAEDDSVPEEETGVAMVDETEPDAAPRRRSRLFHRGERQATPESELDCAVCASEMPGIGQDDETRSAWIVSQGVAVCPSCQGEGWDIPPGEALPRQRTAKRR